MSVMEAEWARPDDRRLWPRVILRLPVRVVDTESSFSVLTGETVDVSVGGVLASTDGPLGGAMQATVQLDLPGGQTLVCEARVASGGAVDEGWQYRLAFGNLEVAEIEALEQLVGRAS